jgi:hypothetical protein
MGISNLKLRSLLTGPLLFFAFSEISIAAAEDSVQTVAPATPAAIVHPNQTDRDTLDALFDAMVKSSPRYTPAKPAIEKNQGQNVKKHVGDDPIARLIEQNNKPSDSKTSKGQKQIPAKVETPPTQSSTTKNLPALPMAAKPLTPIKPLPIPAPKLTTLPLPSLQSPSAPPTNSEAPGPYYNSPESVPPSERLNVSPMKKSPQGTAGERLFGNSCNEFIDADGNYGELAHHIIKHLRPEIVPIFFDNTVITDMHRICKNFSHWGERQKVQFWIWTIAAMAAAESSCNPKNPNKHAVHGTAVGLLQLPLVWARGHSDPYHCNATSLTDAKTNISCSLKVLYYQLSEQHQLYSYHPSPEFYWAVLTPSLNHRATDVVAHYGPCHSKVLNTNPEDLEPLPEE